MKNNNGSQVVNRIIGSVLSLLLFLCILMIYSANYLLNSWGELSFATVLYQLLSPLKGTNQEIIIQYIQMALLPSIMLTGIIIILWYFIFHVLILLQFKVRGVLFGHNVYFCLSGLNIKKNAKKLKNAIGLAIIAVIAIVLMERGKKIGLFEYLNNIANRSIIFEEEYANPDNTLIQFNEKKKNLIYIYLESMESTYADKKSGGQKETNYIPNLTQIAEENISFSDNDKNGGLLSASGTGWTMAAILGSSSGVPYKLPIGGNAAGDYMTFLPGLICLGDILQDYGYTNYFMCGSQIAFGGRESFLAQHGNYEIYDYDTAIADQYISKDYYEFWGFEDKKLYEYAKIKLNEIANKGDNFNFTLLTVDTHHPEGYICEICSDIYEEQYGNVISCADRQIKSFLDWAKEQSWYDNTVIVIIGDHTSMNNTFFEDVEKRTIYNCIINSNTPVEGQVKNRQACILDMFPTTLAAMGAKIEGNRLGMGTNLFSDRQTLIEEMGIAEFNSQISRYSKYYNDRFIKGER